MTITLPVALDPGPSPLQLVRARGRVRGGLALLGPAFVAAVAYVDPGNFATNSAAGADHGFLLVWVVVLANLLAVLVQSLTAKLGLATGRNLPELCREHFPRPVTRFLWAQAELVAMATDVAEVIGGAVALHLLLGTPLLAAGVVTGVASFALLSLRGTGYRGFEVAVAVLLGVILVAFAINLARVGAPLAAVGAGLVPRLDGTSSLLLSTGILGATVMPHVIYVHSALAQSRIPATSRRELRCLLRGQRVDIAVALGAAGLINVAMLVTAAVVFGGHSAVRAAAHTLDGVHAGLAARVSPGAATVFALALLAAGLASTSVGTYAGEVVMEGFMRRRVPLALRRVVTLVPALAVLGGGMEPTRALVLSQVVLSFGIPFALVPLVLLTRRGDVMGELVNRRPTTAAAAATAALVIGLNLFLLVQLTG